MLASRVLEHEGKTKVGLGPLGLMFQEGGAKWGSDQDKNGFHCRARKRSRVLDTEKRVKRCHQQNQEAEHQSQETQQSPQRVNNRETITPHLHFPEALC